MKFVFLVFVIAAGFAGVSTETAAASTTSHSPTIHNGTSATTKPATTPPATTSPPTPTANSSTSPPISTAAAATTKAPYTTQATTTNASITTQALTTEATSASATSHAATTHHSSETPTSTSQPSAFDSYTYDVTFPNKSVCVRLSAALQYTLVYEVHGENGTTSMVTHTQVFTNDTSVTGTCPEPAHKKGMFSSIAIHLLGIYLATFEFSLDSSNMWFMSNRKLDIDFDKFSSALVTGHLVASNRTLANETQTIPFGDGLTCSSEVNRSLNTLNKKANVTVTLTMKDLLLKPFGHIGSPSNTHCTVDPIKNIVSIAVGCGFAAFVLITVSAYIIKTRKSRNRNSYKLINQND
eukprot:m.309147 g.309147  ORF g.309147 m.309147 type:complete len:353 (+) comp45606_c0_seq1:14-1072(+)